MASVVKALEASPLHESIVCVTGQHREMLDQVVNLFQLNIDYDFNVMRPNQTLADITSQVVAKLQKVIEEERPDWILVQGDTTTCFSAGLVGFYNHVKVGHVEAGLRTYNLQSPFPEEANRQLVSKIVTFHFAPTEMSKDNLLKECIPGSNIFVTGNTVIDSLLWAQEHIQWQEEWGERYGSATEIIKEKLPYVLITGHRRENHGEGLINICQALKILAERYTTWHFVYPVHLNPNVQKPVYEMLSGIDNVHLVEPLSYAPFVYALVNCSLVLTDSGGIQEEAPSLGKPVLVMRDTTERPEGVTAGTARLVGTDVDAIVSNVAELITDKVEYEKMARAVNPYGDGKAAESIIRTLY